MSLAGFVVMMAVLLTVPEPGKSVSVKAKLTELPSAA